MSHRPSSGGLLIPFGVAVVLVVVGLAHAVLAPPPSGPVAAHATPRPPLPALGTRGTRIVNRATGQPVTLIGASRSKLEYTCPADPATFVTGQGDGDGHFAPSDFAAMRSWGMNTLRLPLSSVFWRRCPGYQQMVATIVANATAAGFYVLLTLQWDGPLNLATDFVASPSGGGAGGGTQYPLPDATTDVAFWRQVALAYRARPNVLFGLFSEPHDITWAQWRDGGAITVHATTTGFPRYPASGVYQAIGMPALARLVRAIAPNLIVVGGLEYAYDLSGIVQGDAISDVANVAYDTHPFDYTDKQPANWATNILPTARRYPVIIAEFGQYDCGTTYLQQVIQTFTPLGISWLAWNWSTGGCGGPSLLVRWDGTPSEPYGAYLKQQMLARAAQR